MRSAYVDSNEAPPTGSVHKSRGNRVVCMCVQLNTFCSILCLDRQVVFCVLNECF